MRTSKAMIGAVVFGWVASGWAWSTRDAARAAEPAPAVTDPGCVLRGTAPPAKGTLLFDTPTGGRVIAVFSGALTPLSMSAIPIGDATARARVSTSTPESPAFRIDGFVRPAELPLYTMRDLPVVGSHVAIASHQAVKLVGAGADGLRVERTVLATRGQVLSASAPCDAFALSPSGPMPWDVDQEARGYRMKESIQDVDLYDRPGGALIFTLKMLAGTTRLFRGTEVRRGYVNVRSRSDIVIDGWVRLRALEPMRKGELMEPFITPPLTGAQITLDTQPQLKRAHKEIAIRGPEPGGEYKPIGAIEPGTEFYVVANYLGWSSVLPKTLAVSPAEGGGFWIDTTELEIP